MATHRPMVSIKLSPSPRRHLMLWCWKLDYKQKGVLSAIPAAIYKFLRLSAGVQWPIARAVVFQLQQTPTRTTPLQESPHTRQDEIGHRQKRNGGSFFPHDRVTFIWKGQTYRVGIQQRGEIKICCWTGRGKLEIRFSKMRTFACHEVSLTSLLGWITST